MPPHVSETEAAAEEVARQLHDLSLEERDTLIEHGFQGEYSTFRDIVAMALTVGFERYCRQQQALMNRSDRRPALMELARRGVPSLITCGRLDQLIPYASQYKTYELMAKASPDKSAVSLKVSCATCIPGSETSASAITSGSP